MSIVVTHTKTLISPDSGTEDKIYGDDYVAPNSHQIAGFAIVAETGAYADLTGKPTLGTAAATNATDYATAAQGATADSALQPAGNGSSLTGLTKGQVGLGNVDNTSDANKPVSTATQTALDLKANIASPTFTGTVTLPAGQVVNGVTLTTGGGTTNFLRADGSYAAPTASVAWGGITGTLSSQTDLQTALNLKAPLASPTFTGTVSGITAAMVGAPSGSGTSTGTNTGDDAVNSLYSGLAASKQDTLVSATNIKTINGSSVLGSGDLVVSGTDPWTYIALSSDFVTSSATAVAVTGLAFTPAASTKYQFEGRFLLRTATTTVGPRPGLAWPTGMSDGAAQFFTPSSATANLQTNGNISATILVAVGGLPTTNGSWLGTLDGVAVAGLTPSGNIQVNLASETGGTNVTMMAGSFIRYRTY